MALNRRNQATLDAIFAKPVSPNIRWSAIETLLGALGATLTEARGSRVAIELNGQEAVFHRPHPRPVTDRGAVVSMRRFLTQAGVTPESQEAEENDESAEEENDESAENEEEE
jgi:hypothetical protein